MAICLLENKIKDFKEALKKKDIKMEDLLNLGTEELTVRLKEYAGDNAKDVALLFEQKRILKNKFLGIKNAVSKLGEVGRYDPAKKAIIDQALKDFRAQQQERIFSPQEGETFYNALADKIMGTHITREEAKTIFDLQAKADELKKSIDETIPTKQRTPEQQKAALTYGAAEVIAKKYAESLKNEDLSLKDLAKKTIQETKQAWSENKPKAAGELLLKTIKTITDNSISIVASFDNSFIGRQGLKTLMTHPATWWNMAKNSFVDIYKTLGGKDSRDALFADIYSRENFMNGEYDMAKLVPRTEEQYPTSLPSKFPILGRFFHASENAFTGSAIRARADLFDLLKEKAIKNGVEWNKTQIMDNGKLISSLTARGQLPYGHPLESSAVKLVMWAPRMLKANWDVLTIHTGGYGLETAFARKEAALNLAKIAGETALIMMIANAMKPGSAETDPTSTNFGKIKVGNTTFDITGGAASLIVLASRIITNTSKSSISGVKMQLGSGYGQTSRFDVFLNFLEGKTTPPVGAVIDWMKGKNFQGQKPTISNTLYSTFTPLLIQNAIGLKDNHSAEAVLGVILDGMGINANTRTPSTDWGQNTGVELQQFRDKIGDIKFKEANDLYNQRVNDWQISVRANPQFSTLTDDEKQKVITAKKGKIKNTVFRQYNFKYQAPKTKKLPKF